MANQYSGDVTANGIQIHYQRTGGDNPPLLLAHGVSSNGLSWTRLAAALQAQYDVIAYDLRGHGLSSAPPSGYSFADNAADMAGLIAALGLERPHVIGHSLGAATAAYFAAAHGRDLASLVLEDPPWGTAWGAWEASTEGMSQWFLSLGSQTREALIADGRQSHPSWPEDETALWAEAKLQVSPNVVQTFAQPAPAWQDTLRQISCPVLLITGDVELGAMNTVEDIEAHAAAWQDGRSVHIPGAGHTVHSDRFEAYLAAVQAFLAEVDGG